MRLHVAFSSWVDGPGVHVAVSSHHQGVVDLFVVPLVFYLVVDTCNHKYLSCSTCATWEIIAYKYVWRCGSLTYEIRMHHTIEHATFVL